MVELNGKVNVGKVDCTIDKTLCSDFGVRGYPTLKMVKDGKKVLDYSGGRDLDTLKVGCSPVFFFFFLGFPRPPLSLSLGAVLLV